MTTPPPTPAPARPTPPQRRVIVGVCGGSASGKSLLADTLQALLGPRAQILSQDRYYHDSSHLDPASLAATNFDHPDAIDMAAFSEDLASLRRGHTIRPPQYCFVTHARQPGRSALAPAPVTIVEGLFIYQLPALRDCYDLRIYVHADSDIRLLRRIQRDVAQRGRSLAAVAAQYLDTVKPMHEQHVEPNRAYADCVVAPLDLDQLRATAAALSAQIASLL